MSLVDEKVCVNVYICMYMCIHIHTYIYTHTQSQRWKGTSIRTVFQNQNVLKHILISKYFIDMCWCHILGLTDNPSFFRQWKGTCIRSVFCLMCIFWSWTFVLLRLAVCCNVLQCVATIVWCAYLVVGFLCCSVLQCVPMGCSDLQSVAACCNYSRMVYLGVKLACCSVSQCVAACCSVLQCVAMGCNYCVMHAPWNLTFAGLFWTFWALDFLVSPIFAAAEPPSSYVCMYSFMCVCVCMLSTCVWDIHVQWKIYVPLQQDNYPPSYWCILCIYAYIWIHIYVYI